MIRWKGFLIVVILLGLGMAFSWMFMDRWIESGLEKTGQAVTGARVEIDRLDFHLLALSIQWDRLQVADPQNTLKNILETGRAAFNVNASALLRKRFVVEELTLKDVRSGTPRAYDGALPKKKPKKEAAPGALTVLKDRMEKEVQKLPVMHLDVNAFKRQLNMDSLVAKADLKMPARTDSVKKEILKTAEKWESFYADFHPQNDLEKIRADFAAVDVKQIKTVPELISVYEKVEAAKKTLNALSETIDGKSREIHSDFNQIGSYKKQIEAWADEDYHRILEKARIPDFSTGHIGDVLFGPILVYKVNRYLDYLEMAEKIIPLKSDQPKKEKPKRMKGQNIKFPERHGQPVFLIEKIHLSGQTGATQEKAGLMMNGIARGVTSEPGIYGRPTTVDLRTIGAPNRSTVFSANLDHTTDPAKDRFELKIENIPLDNVLLQESSYLPSRIQKGWADVSVATRLDGSDAIFQIEAQTREVNFDFKNSTTEDMFTSVVNDLIRQTGNFILKAEIVSRGEGLDLKVSSNLDDQISHALNRKTGQVVMEAQSRIQNRIRQLTGNSIAELDTLFDGKKSALTAPLDGLQKEANDLELGVQQKMNEITEDVKQRQKSELGEKSKKLLDAILKKKL